MYIYFIMSYKLKLQYQMLSLATAVLHSLSLTIVQHIP